MKYGQPILLVIFLCCILGCGGSHRAEKEKAGDDLQQIKDSGELVVLIYIVLPPTLSTAGRTWDSSMN